MAWEDSSSYGGAMPECQIWTNLPVKSCPYYCQSSQYWVLTSGSDVTIVAVKKTISNPDICATRCISQLSLANATLSVQEQRK